MVEKLKALFIGVALLILLGVHAERIERVDDLKSAFKRAISQTELGIPALLEIITAEEPIFPGG